jgi:nitrite reductase/ring-hydroxylating ferredoxin subunit
MTDVDGPLSAQARRALRRRQSRGISRRTLLRRSIGAGLGVLVFELVGGTLSFLWSAAAVAIGPARVRVGTLAELVAVNPGLPIADGYPAYVAAARAFVILVDPGVGRFVAGADPTGDGEPVNVRALSQVCPHLGCRPNPCLEDFWFHCPCHQSRYDRLGSKPAGERFGPAPRGMDRLAVEVDGEGVLTILTGQVTLGPLPVALGQPGLIAPRVADGCL